MPLKGNLDPCDQLNMFTIAHVHVALTCSWGIHHADASAEDTANLWVARMIEKADWCQDNAICLAIIRHAILQHIACTRKSAFRREDFAHLEQVLTEALAYIQNREDKQPPPEPFASWMVPIGVHIAERLPDRFADQYAYYWSTSQWKGDFLAALENQFWAYKDYAHGAGKGKMDFLRQLAEVWIAAATTALVRYAENDKRTWRATARMLRHHADMIEVDGLRALPWGAWGYMPEEAAAETDADCTAKEAKQSR